MPGDPKECRRHALTCVRLAQTSPSPQARQQFADLASEPANFQRLEVFVFAAKRLPDAQAKASVPQLPASGCAYQVPRLELPCDSNPRLDRDSILHRWTTCPNNSEALPFGPAPRRVIQPHSHPDAFSKLPRGAERGVVFKIYFALPQIRLERVGFEHPL